MLEVCTEPEVDDEYFQAFDADGYQINCGKDGGFGVMRAQAYKYEENGRATHVIIRTITPIGEVPVNQGICPKVSFSISY